MDRQDEAEAVIQTIRQGSKLFLVGPRCFGKTSILNTAEYPLHRGNAFIFGFDPERFPSLDLLVAAVRGYRETIHRHQLELPDAVVQPTTPRSSWE